MNFEMNLVHQQFLLIKDGSKLVEVRLNDERRKQLKVNDTITFTDNETLEKITKKIINLNAYKSFSDVYGDYPNVYLGALAFSKEEYINYMLSFYTEEQVNEFGILAIELDRTDLDLREKFDSGSVCFDGKLLKVHNDNITLPNNVKATREWISHKGACAILYIDENDNVLLERQYRYPFNKVFLEIPAGKLNSALENHLECAKREFQEETGFVSLDMKYLGEYAISIAYSTEIIYIFYTEKVIKDKTNFDEDELLTLMKLPFDKVFEMCNNGEITDSKTIIAINLYNNLVRGK